MSVLVLCMIFTRSNTRQARPTNISELKVALQSIWNDFPEDPIDRSIPSSTKRLKLEVDISNTECD